MSRELRTENRGAFVPLPTAVEWSHVILEPRLRAGDIVVDATAGNGHDAVFLAQKVLPGGRVFVFDVQMEALEQTRGRISDLRFEISEAAGVTLHHAGHEKMAAVLPEEARGKLRAVMFNLGYLPGGDKTRITRVDTTLMALQQAVEWLAGDGMTTVVVYPGHDGGREEADAVVRWMEGLPSEQFEAQRIGYVNFRATTPFCLVVRKRA